jgi:hypothetical protein
MSLLSLRRIPTLFGDGWGLYSPLVSIQWSGDRGWVRLGRRGPGVSFIRHRGYVPFSVRNGYQRFWRVGRFIVTGVVRA